MCLNDRGLKLFPEVGRLIEDTVADSRCQEELTELQLQLIYCADAEGDRRTIQEEIMPELMKGSNLRVTGHGIEEVEEDPMEDVLNPGASERRMENMEAAMNKMMEMQKQGSDIYFGGFSQMKRFPFFYDICNWFLPFDMSHPAVSKVMKGARWSSLLRKMLDINRFCDSDKYSFVLAFEQVMNQMPDNLMKMLERGEENALLYDMDKGVANAADMESPAFIRRMYLQGLYRFFMVYSGRSMFRNPFVDAQADLQAQTQGLVLEEVLYVTLVVGIVAQSRLHVES